MKGRSLVLVLGDQLTPDRGALRDARPGRDTIVMAEVQEEASYVRHNRHKIALLFASMRHFRDEMRELGFEVRYYEYEAGLRSLRDAVMDALAACPADRITCCEPGEFRLLAAMRRWQLPVPLEIVEDDRFLATHELFMEWAQDRKQLRMEYFYRLMRRKYGLLMDASDAPEGGKWNYDAQNRRGWRGAEPIPDRPPVALDAITAEVIDQVNRAFPDHPGDLSRFYLGVTRAQADIQLQWFVDHGLARFGTYQDAMAEESPWLFHSLISMYLNMGLLEPLQVCRRVETAWREGSCDLAAAEGFIRQVLGWREYVRGIYWMNMPDYAQRNSLAAHRPLPEWFWSGDTDLRCLNRALQQSLELGYAHHIQRLMVIGNFALLTGLDVKQVCEWYLAVYVDAYEWVELPNTLGMALHGDDGLMASKPYAASGKYIQRQGDHCKQCPYTPARSTGESACPFNSLYWRFIDTHLDQFSKNPRMGLTVKNWERKSDGDRDAILTWAQTELVRLVPAEPAA